MALFFRRKAVWGYGLWVMGYGIWVMADENYKPLTKKLSAFSFRP